MVKSSNTVGCLFECDDVAPARGWIFASEVVLDGIGEGIGFSFSVFLGVLLASEHDGFRAVDFVDVVDDGIEAAHLLELLSVGVEEILLYGVAGCNAHDNDSCFLILIPLLVDLLKEFVGSLYDGCGGTGGSKESCFLEVAILRQILPEGVGL